jgi:hypothetical protein
MPTSRWQTRKYLLLDTSVIVDYYLPETSTLKKTRLRITTIIDSIRNRMANVQLFVPDFCIVETYNAFTKWRFGERILPHGKPVSKKRYDEARNLFREDTLNGKVIQQYELCRYHVIAADLISAVDYHYQYFRKKGDVAAKLKFTSIKVVDTLIGAMGIWLAKLHGRENVAIVTADNRIEAIIGKAQRVSATAMRHLGLRKIAVCIGLEYSPEIFPEVLHLEEDSDHDLKSFFGKWPLPVRQTEMRF